MSNTKNFESMFFAHWFPLLSYMPGHKLVLSPISLLGILLTNFSTPKCHSALISTYRLLDMTPSIVQNIQYSTVFSPASIILTLTITRSSDLSKQNKYWKPYSPVLACYFLLLIVKNEQILNVAHENSNILAYLFVFLANWGCHALPCPSFCFLSLLFPPAF